MSLVFDLITRGGRKEGATYIGIGIAGWEDYGDATARSEKLKEHTRRMTELKKRGRSDRGGSQNMRVCM